jgi:hypothetical protein
MSHIEDQLYQIIYADFIIEDSEVQPLDHRIVKKFTSLAKNPIPSAHIYDPTLFRWNFGDNTPIVETGQRTIYHIYEHPGKYLVKHQACNFCTCSGWNMCYKTVKIKDNEEENNHS